MKEDKQIIQTESIKIKGHISNTKFWYLRLFVASLSLCFLFAIISQLMLLHSNLAIALLLVLILIAVSVIFDVIGVAVAASHIKPFLEMKSRGYAKGIESAIKLVKNADKVSSICTDVIGDICSIVSGASGVAISIIIISELPSVSSAILSTLISSLIAALTVLGKALGKSYAINYSTNILLRVGKIMEFGRKRGYKK